MAYGVSAYKTTSVMTADPYKLILMLYDACLKNLNIVKEGINEKNIVKRSEALYKVIEIINELFISVDGETEQAAFLRGLYLAILVELPKVNLTNDITIIDRTIRYISELRRLWIEEVINKRHLLDTNTQKEAEPINHETTDKKNFNEVAPKQKVSMPYYSAHI